MDPQFPVPQLQMMQQSVGILQHLAIKNAIVLVSNKNTRQSKPGWPSAQEVQAASLLYAARTHIRIHYDDAKGDTLVWLKSHPYLEPAFKRIFRLELAANKYHNSQQASLSDFF